MNDLILFTRLVGLWERAVKETSIIVANPLSINGEFLSVGSGGNRWTVNA